MRGFAALSFAACAAAAAVPSFSTGTIHDGVAPILSSSNADAIPNRYIIKFKKHVTDSHASDHHTWLSSVHSASQESRELELRKRGQFPLVDTVFEGLKHTYKIGGAFMGYAGHFDDATIEEIRRHPDVSPNSYSCSAHRSEHHPLSEHRMRLVWLLLQTVHDVDHQQSHRRHLHCTFANPGFPDRSRPSNRIPSYIP